MMDTSNPTFRLYPYKEVKNNRHIMANRNPWNRTIYTLDISQLLYQWATFRKLTKIKVWQRSPSYRIKQHIRITFMRTRSLLFSLPNVWFKNHSQLKPYQCRPLYFHHTMSFSVDYRNYHHIQPSLKWHKFFNASQLRYANILCGKTLTYGFAPYRNPFARIELA